LCSRLLKCHVCMSSQRRVVRPHARLPVRDQARELPPPDVHRRFHLGLPDVQPTSRRSLLPLPLRHLRPVGHVRPVLAHLHAVLLTYKHTTLQAVGVNC
jgi:hypothetical protein